MLGALVGGVVYTTRLRGLVAGLTALLVGLSIAVAFTPLCARATGRLIRRDAVVPADAVFVLSSRIQSDGELTTSAMSRLLAALELLGEHEAPRLVLSELAPPSRSYREVARKLMDHLGLSQEIVSVGPVDNTHDEAVAVGRLAAARGWKKVLVVTSPTHTRRACAALEHEGVGVVCVPSMETQFDVEALDHADDRLRAFEALAHEWIGIYVYRWRGWLDGGSR